MWTNRSSQRCGRILDKPFPALVGAAGRERHDVAPLLKAVRRLHLHARQRVCDIGNQIDIRALADSTEDLARCRINPPTADHSSGPKPR
jgi:hypothetical protein